MAILLVRHAAPEVASGLDPRRWALSGAGRIAAAQLGARLPSYGVWVSSTETKAYQTLSYAAGADVEIAQDSGFDEVRREEPFDEGFRARRLAWVAGRLDQRHAGWETPTEAAARFDRAVSAHATPGAPLVIASHGMALTAWLVHARGRVPRHEAARFWEALAFPDLIEVGAADGPAN